MLVLAVIIILLSACAFVSACVVLGMDWYYSARLPRVIYDRQRLAPYLTRYYLLGKPTMVDDSDPFDKWGSPRPGIRWSKLPFGVYLHKIHQPDDAPNLHNHPWRWALSLVLSGAYWENRVLGVFRPRVERFTISSARIREVKAGMVNFIRHKDFHAIVRLLPKKRGGAVWTLFVVGPRCSSWGFLVGDRVMPWQTYLRVKEADDE